MNAKTKHLPPILSLVALVVTAALPASAQSVAIASDEVRIEDEPGSEDTLLGPGSLVLGRPSTASGVFTGGVLQLKDFVGNTSFQVTADADSAHFSGTWHINNSINFSTVRLMGQTGTVDIGTSGTAGDLTLRDSSADTNITLDGETGTATNWLNGNGFVKGWARMKADGTLLSCYNCDSDPLKTLRTALGTYYVDFSPIASDISTRPRMAVLDKFDLTVSGVDTITLTDDNTGDPSRIRIFTGPAQDHSFTIMVY